ncbi:hypothetical protein GWI33_017311 [Rhynchophorus ferrugineus]|uniref:Uncharacterized protein n=1 Tax=Rhynchophorus ferrugineus TaxID=354439 RepID=A0A834HYT8_RHYFE|nr:hypothetical protein GWI33_017311 [Rhynchophorus ferrugineus]
MGERAKDVTYRLQEERYTEKRKTEVEVERVLKKWDNGKAEVVIEHTPLLLSQQFRKGLDYAGLDGGGERPFYRTIYGTSTAD